jgi:hypothetical protein
MTHITKPGRAGKLTVPARVPLQLWSKYLIFHICVGCAGVSSL